MLELKVEIEGKTVSDLVFALEEVTRLVSCEYVEGTNSNSDGNFFFTRTGEEQEGEDV